MDPNDGSQATFSDVIDSVTPLIQTAATVYQQQQTAAQLAQAGYVMGPGGQVLRAAGVAPALNVNMILIAVAVVGAIVLLKH